MESANDKELDQLLNEHFAGRVVRKDLTKLIKEGANVPVYVLEYLLGMYCASDDPEIIEQGLRNVKTVLAENYVRPDEAEKVKSLVRERGSYKVIDRVTVKLNERKDKYEASFSNLGIKDAEISAGIVKEYEKLLVGGNIGMIASLLIMAILIWTIGIASSAWIIIVCLSLFIVFFGISWGPVLWVMLPELFPMRARGAATGISALVLNIGTLIVSLFFPILSDALSTEWVFFIFAFIGVLAMIFVIKFLPETRGRSLEEIEYELRERTGARTE